MATHSSILAWKIPMDRESSLVGYSPLGHKESDADTTERLNSNKHVRYTVNFKLLETCEY